MRRGFGAQERTVDTDAQTMASVEVRENTRPLSGKDNLQHIPNLSGWHPPAANTLSEV
jgi:hypothetical protein